MALKQIPPLDKKQWDFVQKRLSEKPSEEDRKRIIAAVKQAKKIKTYY